MSHETSQKKQTGVDQASLLRAKSLGELGKEIMEARLTKDRHRLNLISLAINRSESYADDTYKAWADSQRRWRRD